MINSLFMLGSSYNKNRILSIVFMIGWISYMFIGYMNKPMGVFPILNVIVFLSICIIINLVKNRKVNMILSITSVLIWSVIIDIVCYFFYSIMNENQDILSYVFQGIVFNYKYIFSNILAICLINCIDNVIEYVKIFFKKEVKVL